MARGQLRIYLGAAPGAGKTYAMLAEGQRRRARGTDVVIGLLEAPPGGTLVPAPGDAQASPRGPSVAQT